MGKLLILLTGALAGIGNLTADYSFSEELPFFVLVFSALVVVAVMTLMTVMTVMTVSRCVAGETRSH